MLEAQWLETTTGRDATAVSPRFRARSTCESQSTLGRESQCICGTKVKIAWDAAHSGSQTSQCN